MDLKQFLDKWNWKVIDYDWSYWYQCKDYTNQYTKEVFGIESPKWNAKDVWKSNWGEKFEKHKNTADFLPLPWDICIWGNGEFGHIGIVVSANLKNMVISDQNTWSGNWDGTGNNKIRTHQYPYKNVLWFIRYKKDDMQKNIDDFIKRWYTTGENPEWTYTRKEVWALLETIIIKNNLK